MARRQKGDFIVIRAPHLLLAELSQQIGEALVDGGRLAGKGGRALLQQPLALPLPLAGEIREAWGWSKGTSGKGQGGLCTGLRLGAWRALRPAAAPAAPLSKRGKERGVLESGIAMRYRQRVHQALATHPRSFAAPRLSAASWAAKGKKQRHQVAESILSCIQRRCPRRTHPAVCAAAAGRTDRRD